MESNLQKSVSNYLNLKGVHFFWLDPYRNRKTTGITGIADFHCYKNCHFVIETKDPNSKNANVRKKQLEWEQHYFYSGTPYLRSNNFEEIASFIDSRCEV